LKIIGIAKLQNLPNCLSIMSDGIEWGNWNVYRIFWLTLY